MADIFGRVALVYDRVNKWGGAEQVLLSLHELFPEAPLFTSVYNSETAQWAKVFPRIIPSFLQNFPGAKSHHEWYPWLTPLAFESLDFSEFDLVISVTSADAKGIITKPSTFHLCYCLTPTRYLWSHEEFYKSQLDPSLEVLTVPTFNYLKKWDKVAASRPDAYIAISNTVKDRIAKFYSRSSEVVYPPVDVDFYNDPAPKPPLENFFLYVGRLVAYKRAEILVETFNELQLPLAIVGSGNLEDKLRSIAKSNVSFYTNVSNDELVSFYQHARALLFYHEEDFGIVPVESMASGTPVIGLNRGGVSETVVHGSTGLLISEDPQELKSTITNFDKDKFDAKVIKKQAQKFSKRIFKKEFINVLTKEWKKYKNICMS